MSEAIAVSLTSPPYLALVLHVSKRDEHGAVEQNPDREGP